MRFYKVFGPIVCQGKRVAAIFHLSTTTRAKQIESIVSRHCWNSFSHFIRFSLNWLKTCAKYFKMLQLAFILLFISSSRNSHLLKLVWNSYVYLWQQNLSIVPTIFFTGAQFILGRGVARGGGVPPNLADRLTLFKPWGGQIIPVTLLPAPLDSKCYLNLC